LPYFEMLLLSNFFYANVTRSNVVIFSLAAVIR